MKRFHDLRLNKHVHFQSVARLSNTSKRTLWESKMYRPISHEMSRYYAKAILGHWSPKEIQSLTREPFAF